METQKGKAATVAKNKYRDKTYDRVEVVLQKGKKEVVQSHAAARGESVNGFIGRAIDETMERDNAAPAASTGETTTKGDFTE